MTPMTAPQVLTQPGIRHAAPPAGRGGLNAAARAAVLTVAVIAIQFVMVAAYAWSAASTEPHDVPVAVTGPPAAVATVTGEIDLARPGAFRLVPAATPARAAADITGRLTYGAIVLTGRVPRVLVASAASPAVANVLTSLAGRLDGTASHPASVRDVVPASAADPTGAGFGFTVIPLMLSSVVGGALLTLGIRRPWLRAGALVGFGAGGGAATAAIARAWLGILPGSFPALASVAGLAVLAVAAAVSGLGQLAGRYGRPTAGIAAGAAVIVLLGNPFSGAGSAPEMLPGAWGLVGQCLPNGAVATLLRSVCYFGGARSAGPWTVLATWAAAGLLLVLAARPRRAAWHRAAA